MNNYAMNLLRKSASRSIELLIEGNVNDKDIGRNDEDTDFNDNQMEDLKLEVLLYPAH